MKKNLFAVVLLAGAVSMATAQTSGKVGVNTSTPQATLDVKPSAANAAATATTNEGLLIPRLTKARVANIAAANLVEGTQVYVTDDVTASDNATFNGTGKGFYYYNGTKWVRQSDADAAAAVTEEPWRVTGTATSATQNTQNIYQTGAVAIGTNPAAQENNKLYIENKVTDVAATGRTSAIYGVVESIAAGAKNAINLQVTDLSTTGTGTLTGSVITATDSSSGSHSSYGSSSTLKVSATKSNQGQFNVGDYNLVQLMPSAGSYSTSFVYANMAIATMPTNSTGDVTTESLRAYSGYAYPQPGGGRTFSAQNLYGAHIAARPRPAGGTVNLGDLYAVSAQADLQGTSGTVNITGRSVALRATSYLSENSAKNIGSLYGVQIEGGQTGGSGTIGKAYGLYINRFRFNGAPADQTFNLYSEGADTKNYFQGQVGIGIDAPTEKLEVAGNVKVSSLSSAAVTSTATTDRIVVADENGLLKVKDAAELAKVTAGSGLTKVGNEISLGGPLNGTTTINLNGDDLQIVGDTMFDISSPTHIANQFHVMTSDKSEILIAADATTKRIVIGNLNPLNTTEKLEVAGNVKADKFIAGTATFPDYVFHNYYTGTASNLNPNYKFTTLAETEKFIKTNGHLPGFEKAETVVAKGEFSVSETAIKSLEKIEELYLHVIELEKRVKSLEKSNAELKAVK